MPGSGRVHERSRVPAATGSLGGRLRPHGEAIVNGAVACCLAPALRSRRPRICHVAGLTDSVAGACLVRQGRPSLPLFATPEPVSCDIFVFSTKSRLKIISHSDAMEPSDASARASKPSMRRLKSLGPSVSSPRTRGPITTNGAVRHACRQASVVARCAGRWRRPCSRHHASIENHQSFRRNGAE